MLRPAAALLIAAALLAAPAAAAEFTAKVERVRALTGPEAPTDMQDADVCGTDIGTIAETPDRLYFAFGDTFGYAGGTCSPFGPHWRSNVLAHTNDRDPSDGITLDGWLTDTSGQAKAVTEGRHQAAFAGEQTRIPTAMAAIGNRLYLHFMSVHGFAAQGGVWTCNFSRFTYSDDAGEHWTEAAADLGSADSNFDMLALSPSAGTGNEGGAYLYAIGTKCGRFGAARAARVATADVLDPSAWRYFDGKDWVAAQDKATDVIPAPVGEGSLAWNAGLKRWMYTTLNEHKGAIELRLATRPEGPWGDPVVLAVANQYPSLYGAFTTPAFIAPDGMSFYFVMSQFGPYETYIMKATLNRP